MFVKCINNNKDSRLRVGDIYEVNIKILNETSLSLYNMSGKYKINRFITPENQPIRKSDYYYNSKYNPDLYKKNISYAIPNRHKIRMLEDRLYEIEDMVCGWELSVPEGFLIDKYKRGYKKGYKKIKLEGINRWFSAKSFYYFTKEEAQLIMREEKLDKIIKTLNDE
jgi:hypothetical protein